MREPDFDEYITTLPEDRLPRRKGPKCHACGELIESDLCIFYGNAHHEECLREELEEEMEKEIRKARADVDYEYWE